MPKKVVILAGLPGTGKSSAGRFFKRRGIPVVRMGNLTGATLKKRKLSEIEINEKQVRERLREEFGPDVYARRSLPLVFQSLKTSDLVIIEGMRSPAEWRFFNAHLDSPVIIFIETATSVRHRRLLKRRVRPLTIPEIESREEYEMKELKIEKLKKHSTVIVNDDGQDIFFSRLEKEFNLLIVSQNYDRSQNR